MPKIDVKKLDVFEAGAITLNRYLLMDGTYEYFLKVGGVAGVIIKSWEWKDLKELINAFIEEEGKD